MGSPPIDNLPDARAVTDAALTGLELSRTWIADNGGPDLAGDLKGPLVNIAWAFDLALGQLRDRAPGLDVTDEPRPEE